MEKKPKANYKIMSGYDCRNKFVIILRRNIVSDGAVVVSFGRLSQNSWYDWLPYLRYTDAPILYCPRMS